MKSNLPLVLTSVLVLTAAGCSKTDDTQETAAVPETETQTEVVMQAAPAESNPFFIESPLYMHYPQFDEIDNAYYKPAFERGMQEQLAEIDAIANNPEAPLAGQYADPNGTVRSGSRPGITCIFRHGFGQHQ